MQLRLLLATLTTVLACTAAAQERIVTVGTNVEGKPFNFSQNGQYVGFDQDLLAEIAKDVGFRAQIAPMEFGALIPALQTANIDMAMSSIYMTEARKKAVEFSDPYYMSALGLLVSTSDTTIRTAPDLSGKRVASVTGSVSAAWLKDNVPAANLSLFPLFANAVMELQTGRADAMVYDHPYLAYYAKSEGGGMVKILPDPVGDGIPVGIAFPKGSALVADVNRALQAIRADGRYDAIYKKWFD